MGGACLGRLWASHPRLAFVLHLIVTLALGGFAVSFVFGGAGLGSVLALGIGFFLMAGSLAFFTWSAIKDQWQPDNNSDGSEPAALPSLGVAWGSAQARERVLWSLFAIVFLVGLVLGFARSVLGIALVVLSIALAVVAVRAGRQ